MMTNQTSAAVYNIEEWMQGLEEDASEVEVGKGDANNCRTEQRTLILNMWVEEEDGVEDKAPHDCKETPLVDLPLQGEEVPIG